MQHNTDKEKAGEARQPVESTQIETLTWEAWQEPKPRNYDDAMVEDLAKTHAQTLVKLDKAKAHAEKLAEALRKFLALDFAKATMTEIAPRIDNAVATLAAYEEAKQ